MQRRIAFEMAYLFYTITGLLLIILQTVVLPGVFHVTRNYDLILILVLYLGFYRSLMEGVPMIVLSGLMMDCLSGGPFGIYLTVYGWAYVGVRITIQFLHADSRIVLPVAILAGILLENLVVLLCIALGTSDLRFSFNALKLFFSQVLWALLTGPIVFLFIKSFQTRYEQWLMTMFKSDIDRGDFQT
jgi:cell shape-determining protein MreD